MRRFAHPTAASTLQSSCRATFQMHWQQRLRRRIHRSAWTSTQRAGARLRFQWAAAMRGRRSRQALRLPAAAGTRRRSSHAQMTKRVGEVVAMSCRSSRQTPTQQPAAGTAAAIRRRSSRALQQTVMMRCVCHVLTAPTSAVLRRTPRLLQLPQLRAARLKTPSWMHEHMRVMIGVKTHCLRRLLLPATGTMVEQWLPVLDEDVNAAEWQPDARFVSQACTSCRRKMLPPQAVRRSRKK